MSDLQDIYARFGRAVKAHRQMYGLRQDQVARLVGMERTSIANIEAGRQRVLLHTFLEICAALEIDPASVMPPRASSEALFQAHTPTKEVEKIKNAIAAYTHREIARLKS